MYACMYACMHAWIYVCLYVCLFVCMCVCAYVRMCVCVYVCMCAVCVYVSIYIYMYPKSTLDNVLGILMCCGHIASLRAAKCPCIRWPWLQEMEAFGAGGLGAEGLGFRV